MRRSSRRTITCLVAALGLFASSCAQFVADLPHLTKADLRFRPPQSSKLYSSDGSLITTFHGEQDRTVIPLGRIPKSLQDAVVAIEDERFYEHDGVDVKAIIRAALANASSGEVEEGGSTITQQYVKNTIIAPEGNAAQTIQRKIEEAALARQLEEELTKKEILERYLNTVYFGEGAYGVQAASKTYFGVGADRLSLRQGALLAGIIQQPGAFDPFKSPKAARTRRDLVLDKMAQLGLADSTRVEAAKVRPLGLQDEVDKDRYPAAYFVDYVQKLITYEPRFKFLGRTADDRTKRLFQGGLRIHTTVDLNMQQAAEEAVNKWLPYENDPYGSLVAIEPTTGEVKAMVGGRNYFLTEKKKGKPDKGDRFAKLNLAVLAEPGLGPKRDGGQAAGTGRQAGSAFKPFALAAAISQGIPLSKNYKAAPCMDFEGANAGGNWHVCNYESSDFGSSLSLLEATVNSVNVVYAQLILETGPEAVVNVAHDMGINTTLAAVPSAALGTNPVNPLGMASAYGTFATNGVHHPPVAITKIVNSKGEQIFEDKSQVTQAIPPGVSYIVTSALEQVVSRGTGVYANPGRPAAGKTGTAQEYRDAWFGGFTPGLAAAVWVGYPEGEIEMKPYCASSACRITRTISGSGVTGGSFPARIWHDFMIAALAGTPVSAFSAPVGLVYRTIDTRTGCLATSTTPSNYQSTAPFSAGTEPTESCEPPETEVEVPDVFSFPVDDAVRIVEDAGLVVELDNEPNSTYPPGRVIGQSPSAGELVPEGSTLTLVVSESTSDQGDDNGRGKSKGND